MSNISYKLELFVDNIYFYFRNHSDKLTICAVATAQYVNYLHEKGIIPHSEKKDLNKLSLSLIEKQFNEVIPDFILNGLLEIMDNVESYEYEIISKFIK